MNDKKIAVLDSGIGGLTVLKKLTDYMPKENYVYFGDNKNAPYGNKTIDELFSLTLNNLNELSKLDVKIAVVACYTVSANVINLIKDVFDFEIIGIYPPFYQKQFINAKTLFIGTNATVNFYKDKVTGFDFLALPYLAGDIERKIFSINSIDVGGHFKSVSKDYDYVIMGCTHYPFVREKLYKYFYKSQLINGADTLAQLVKRYIDDHNLQNGETGNIEFIGDYADKNRYVYKNIASRF